MPVLLPLTLRCEDCPAEVPAAAKIESPLQPWDLATPIDWEVRQVAGEDGSRHTLVFCPICVVLHPRSTP